MITLLVVMCMGAAGDAAEESAWDVRSDTWEATDALLRTLPGHEEVGPPRDRTVGIFYHTWHGVHGQSGPHDISKILAAHPEAYFETDHPAWGPMHAMHHWGESIFGYYVSDDEYVFRKHAEMLAHAGVDAIFFDATNQFTYKHEYMTLCKVFAQARQDGVKAPAIGFLCPFGDPARVVSELYDDLYGPGLYQELWFQWKGKPLILADPAKCDPALHDFFTFRRPEPSYFVGPSGPDMWSWLEVYPQHVFENSAGEPEQMSVGVAQNAVDDRLAAFSVPGSKGRSFHDGRTSDIPNAVRYGLNFAEQWDRALEVDPQFVFVTGWNEWTAMRFTEFAGVELPVSFVDMFTQEKSRDIEPMKGGHGDDYYYQLASYVRRYKGVRPQEPASAPATIRIDGDFADWDGVGPDFRAHPGSTVHRNHPGWGDAGVYINETGRNDFILAKVARDDANLYFYIETREPITSPEDPMWMMLFLDADRNPRTGWNGYTHVLNRRSPASGDASGLLRGALERSDGGWNWASVGEVAMAVNGARMEVAIPRALLGLESGPVDITFKWADNIQREDDPLEFTVSGDAAPPGRFNYRYFEGE